MKKYCWPSILFTLFVILHDPNGDRAQSYEGMSQTTVSNLLNATGFLYDFVDQATYLSFLAANQKPILTSTQVLQNQRSDAIDLLNSGTYAPTKLERAAILVTLDEINLIRSLLVPAQSPRTFQQMKTAIQNKINSGAAD